MMQPSILRNHSLTLCALGGLLLVVQGGCKPNSQGPGGAEVPTAGPAVTEPSAPEPEPAPVGQSEEMADDVSVQILDWEATRNLVNAHPGKVVVMDLWATYCPPCIAEFPHLVQLHRMHPDKIACVSVSCDYLGSGDTPESHQAKVKKFLVKQGATFTNVILSTDAETLFNSKIAQSSIPIVYVFDQKGELVGQFPDPKNPDEFTYQANVYPLVEKLLKAE